MAKKENPTAEENNNELENIENPTAEGKKYFSIKASANYSSKILNKSFVKDKTIVSSDLELVNFCKTNGYFTVNEISEEEAKSINKPDVNKRRKRIQ